MLLIIVAAATASIVALAAYLYLKRVQYLNPTEQLLIKQTTQKICINGPAVHFPSYRTTLSYKKRKAVTLADAQHCIVTDDQTGQKAVKRGPGAFFLGPYETASEPQASVSLGENDAVHCLDRSTGVRSLVTGPCVYAPRSPFEVVERRASALTLKSGEYVRVEDSRTGAVRVVRGEARLFLESFEKLLSGTKPLKAWTLSKTEYVRLKDSLTGATRVVRGEGLCVPGPFEESLDAEAPLEAVDLRKWEYSVVQNKTDGQRKVLRGPAQVYLGADETFVLTKKAGATVDEQHAALVRQRETGARRLVECVDKVPFVYVPAASEELVEVRALVKLAEHEAVILRDGVGDYHYRYGSNKGEGRAFFVPPDWETVSLRWSRGRRRERRDLVISLFDCRPQYMSFEFNCRTSDNVELVLEGTFFWEVVDIPKMLRYTSDAPGDVCAHARSSFIALVSKVTLREFMENFNGLAKRASQGDDDFYLNRGIKVHSLEVTRGRPSSPSCPR